MESTSRQNASGRSPSEVALLHERLERTREEVKERLQHGQVVASQAESMPEPMDAAEQTREQDDAVTFTERDRALLREIDHALSKLAAGTYGLSELSGEPIGFRRLESIPWARTTADEADAI
jgi:DnaK suppressor protein